MNICTNCGTHLAEGNKFCPECGTAVVIKEERNKCPNCGEVLNSFTTNCPACGYELRKVSTSSALEKLSNELKRVDAKEMNIYEPKNFVEKVFGKTEEKIRAEQENLEEEREKEKANIIINFNVPNTKEDLVEFALAASANIEKSSTFGILTNEEGKAWLFKLDQVYKKAAISMGNEPEFEIIKEVYDSVHGKMRFDKFKFSIFLWGPLLFILLMCLGSISIIGIIAAIAIIVTAIAIGFLNKDRILRFIGKK